MQGPGGADIFPAMSPRLRTLALLSLSLLVASVASCGGGGGGGQAEAGPVSLVHLLDADTPIVAHVDMDGLRQSPYYALVRDAIMATLGESDRAELTNVLQLLDRTDHIVVGANPTQEQGVILLRGAFEPSHIELVQPPDGHFTHRQHALRGNADSRGVVTADTMILGATEPVLRALDRLDGLLPATGPTLAGFPEAAGRAHLGERDVSVVVLLTEEIRRGFGQGDVEQQLQQSGLSAGASLDARNGIRLSGFFTASTEGAVQVLAGQLREALSEAQGDMTLAMLGLSVLLQQIEITERGTDLLVEFRLDDQQVRDVLERFGPLLQAFLTAL
jgi:hypothetical protein